MTDKQALIADIDRLRREKNAVILAHYYQDPDIQDLADLVGDSLDLSRKAAATDADIIVFAGVHFMAETAKIINPGKKVLIPDPDASCSLAEDCPEDEFRAYREAHPDHTVVTYINCSAGVKALSDIICTSSNAEKVIEGIPLERPIIFAPDRNMGKYLIGKTGRDMLLWDGACVVHEAFAIDKLLALSKDHPSAKIIAHPESQPHVLKVAHYIGSTKGMLNFVKSDECTEFIVATEAGILHQMKKDVPGKSLIPVPIAEDNTCACSECAYMKMNTLEKLHRCLLDEQPEIRVEDATAAKALVPINRMLQTGP